MKGEFEVRGRDIFHRHHLMNFLVIYPPDVSAATIVRAWRTKVNERSGKLFIIAALDVLSLYQKLIPVSRLCWNDEFLV
jgi:hypothetical protein